MKAYEVLEQYGWTQGVFARDKEGRQVDTGHEQAASFCVLGAIKRAYGNNTLEECEAVIKLRERIHAKFPQYEGSLVMWNDEKGRRKEDVIHFLKALNV